MVLIKNNQFVTNGWVFYEPDLESNSTTTGVIFNLQNFTACSHHVPESLKLGLKLANHDSVNSVKPHLDKISLVILEFPSFADGRAYSQAQGLRSQFGFEGEIRATGNVLIDQYAFMQQCGFDSFEIDADVNLDEWKEAADLIPATYTATHAKSYTHIWKLRKVIAG